MSPDETNGEVAGALQNLKAWVRTAEDEALPRGTLHESWKPTAYYVELHARMGMPFTYHTFAPRYPHAQCRWDGAWTRASPGSRASLGSVRLSPLGCRAISCP